MVTLPLNEQKKYMGLADMSFNQHFAVETSVGNFVIELKVKQAPITCAYFIQLLSSGTLTNGTLFRVLTDKNQQAAPRINVVQLGSDKKLDELRTTIEHESTSISGLSHKKWCVSLARFNPGEAYQSFFVCMRDEPALNFGGTRHPDGQGFACFGGVVKGYEVVEKLYKIAGHQEMLEPAINIDSYHLVN
ncbi:peptidylprolyl isomerase [Paraglaciecola arctica]|nr:peptidylprolyl isomerase [Paraglaciecola arctica]